MQENDPIIKAYFTYKIEEEKDSTLIESTQKEMVEVEVNNKELDSKEYPRGSDGKYTKTTPASAQMPFNSC